MLKPLYSHELFFKMPVGQYTVDYIKCDAIGCREWQELPLRSNQHWFNDTLGSGWFGCYVRCCLCPGHTRELYRFVQRDLNRQLYIYIERERAPVHIHAQGQVDLMVNWNV